MPAGGALTAAAIGGPIIGGIIGNMASAEDRERAKQAAAEAYALINAIGAPPDLSKEILYQKFQQVGVLTPETKQAIDIGISKASQITEDPSLRKAQTGALQLLASRAQGGLNGQDRANLNESRASVQRDIEGKRQQILQNMAARGMGGSGAELAAQLSASQGGAEVAAKQSDDIMAMASKNALEAASQSGGMASNIRSQDFNVNNAKAQAADEFNRFNVSNRQNVDNSNVDARNSAAASNLGQQQNIANANTNQTNQETLRQQEAKRQYWQDQLQLAQTKANAKLGQAGQYNQQANSTAKMWTGMGAGVGVGAGAAADRYYDSQKPAADGSKKSSVTHYDKNGVSIVE